MDQIETSHLLPDRRLSFPVWMKPDLGCWGDSECQDQKKKASFFVFCGQEGLFFEAELTFSGNTLCAPMSLESQISRI